MLKFGSFVILGSTSALLISKVDMLMLGSYIDLENVAYYTIAFYIGNAIMIPARSINSISTPLVADAWKNNNIQLIGNIYYKSSINQLILGGVFFLCIWVNIDDIMLILYNLSPKFSGGRYVVLFIALSRVVHLISGVNSSIIINSRYYKFDLLSNIPFLIFIVITNHILIPSDWEMMGISISGINGAAFATFLSTLLFITIKIVFVYMKFKIHPFSINTIKTIFLLFVLYLIISKINLDFNLYYDIILKSGIILLVFIPLIYIMKISEDINNLILKNIKKIRLFL
jgi:O-antigen/teichoic acid export membrane protein